MIIRNDQEDFDTDELVLVDRYPDKLIVITEKKSYVFKGQASNQVWAQINEHSETIWVQDPNK